MNRKIAFLIFSLISFISFGQVFSDERFLTISSKDFINEISRLKSSVGVNMKLNGFYDACVYQISLETVIYNLDLEDAKELLGIDSIDITDPKLVSKITSRYTAKGT